MSIFFTADPHYGHGSIIQFCKRPFRGVEEMNAHLIQCWNEIVDHGDEVYILGDFAFGGKRFARHILSCLKGRKYLCVGSHDQGCRDLYPRFPGDDRYPSEERFERVERDYILTLEKGLSRARFFLAHYCHKVWPESHYGSFHLMGHSHGALDDYTRAEGKLLDVGVDTWGEAGHRRFYPYGLEEVLEIMETRPDNFNQVRGGLEHP